MTNNNAGSTFVAVVLGAAGLVALAKILSEKKCPQCGGINHKDSFVCQYCGRYLK